MEDYIVYKIAICDDEKEFRNRICNICNEYLENECIIYKFEKGEDLLNSNIEYSIIFLDIKMEGISGIEVKDYLEKTDSSSYIVFTTSYDEYIYSAFGKNVCGFIKKPVEKEKIIEFLNKIIFLINNKKIFIFDDEAENKISIKSEDIMYICGEKMYSRVYINNGSNILVCKNLKKWEDELFGDYMFERIHKSYIINYNYVSIIKKQVKMKDGKVFNIRRGKIKEYRIKFFDCLYKKHIF